jgi:DNA polymerase-3 subunit alpha
MAATLSSEIGNTDRIVKLIDECRKLGIRVLPPDVNESGKDFTVVSDGIRFGLCAIKNVGESAIDTVIKAREKNGRFENIFDFCRRVDLRLVNKKCLESLVQAGAFGSMRGHRAQHYENIERASAFGQNFQNHAQHGQSSLFDVFSVKQPLVISYPALQDSQPWTESDKLSREKSVLGFYVSGHPLSKFEYEINEFANVHFGDLSGFKNSSTVKACGIVTSVKKKVDKRNRMMAFVGLEDFSGKAECIVFSDPYAKFQHYLQLDAMVMVEGKGELNGDQLKILVNVVHPMERVREMFTKSVILSINVNDIRENTIVQLRELLERNKGSCPCFLSVTNASSTQMFQTKKFAVEPTRQFVEDVRRVLGPQSVRSVG